MRSSLLANLDRETLQSVANSKGPGWTDAEREYAAMLAKRPTYAKLEADNKALLDENERLKHLLSVSEDYRRAYQDGKYKLYEMGGEICEAAANHLPMSEGPLDRACRKALQPAAPTEHSEPQ